MLWRRVRRGCATQSMRRFGASTVTWRSLRCKLWCDFPVLGVGEAPTDHPWCREWARDSRSANDSCSTIHRRNREWILNSRNCDYAWEFGQARWPLHCSAKALPSEPSRFGARSSAVHRQADRAAQNLRRPSGHRHRERAAVPRAHRSAGAADGDEPNSWRHRQLADGHSAGARCGG